MTYFDYKKNVKIVVDFDIDETVLVKGFSNKIDGEHKIISFMTAYGRCESGILVKLSGYDRLLDVGWLIKIN